MAPISDAAAGLWSRTVAFGCRQLVDSEVTEISPLVIQELIRTTAAGLLNTFPNTAMSASYLRGPSWAPSAALRRAAGYMHSHADQPLAVDQVAAAAGLTVRVLQYGFRRYYGVSPTGYLRRIRLERAHQELQAADPAGGVLIRDVARRWGWATSSQFAAAYRRRYGRLPSQTLRQE